MAIEIKNTLNTVTITVADSTVNSDTEISLIGLGVENYAIELNTNFIKLLENFAGKTIPPKATIVKDALGNVIRDGRVPGQLWFDTSTNNLKFMTSGYEFVSNFDRLEGKTLDEIREYILAGLDTSGILSKAGGTITGNMTVNGAITITKDIQPATNETTNLGSKNNRFRNIYLDDDGIVLGKADGSHYTIGSRNFVYTVTDDNDSVESFPVGSVIVNKKSGEAIIKKSTGKFGKTNNTFRTLANDKENSAVVGGNKFSFLGNVGLVAGGQDSAGASTFSTEKINISTPSNGTFFGNLTMPKVHLGNAMSTGTKAVIQGGFGNRRHGQHNSSMDYFIFSSPSNASYFGEMGTENYGASAASDGSRGVIGAGYDGATGSAHHYTSKYITLDTPNNAVTFGSMRVGYWGSSVSSGSRGVFSGYSAKGWNKDLEYITIQTPQNSLAFGSSLKFAASPNSLSDMIRGVYFGGWTGSWNNKNIEYITIATLGNASYFGNVMEQTGAGAALSNSVYGLSISSNYEQQSATIEYVSISSPANAKTFGSLQTARKHRPAGVSGN